MKIDNDERRAKMILRIKGILLSLALVSLFLCGCGGHPTLEGIFLYCGKIGDQQGIMLSSTDGKSQKVILPDRDARSPFLSPDGKTLYYVTKSGQYTEIASYSLTTGDVRFETSIQPQLEVEDRSQAARHEASQEKLKEAGVWRTKEYQLKKFTLQQPTVSVDGTHLAFVVTSSPKGGFAPPTYHGRIYVKRIGGGLSGPFGNACSRAIVVSDRLLTPAYHAILEFDLDSNPTAGADNASYRTLHEDKAAQGEMISLALSPDGGRLAWVQDSNIFTMDVSGQNLVHVASPKNFRLGGMGMVPMFLDWSPDGNHLAVIVRTGMDASKAGVFIYRSDGKPVYKNAVHYQVEGIDALVDQICWVKDLG